MAGAVPFKFVESIGLLLPVLLPVRVSQDANNTVENNTIDKRLVFISSFHRNNKNYACLIG